MFQWSSDKNAANVEKNGISFDEAKLIFEGKILTSVDRRFNYGEVRLVSIGKIEDFVVVAVGHTDRLGMIRIISARRANRQERRLYNDYIQTTS